MFPGRIDRYNHDLEDDTDDTDDSPVFGLFSSCSPQYRKVHTSRMNSTVDQDSSLDSIRITTFVATTPETPEIPDFRMRLRSTSVILTPDKDTIEAAPPEHRKVQFHLSLFQFQFIYLLVNRFYVIYKL